MLSLDTGCIHPAIIRMKVKGEISEPDFAIYICINPQCGKALGTAPIEKFENMDAEEARAYLQHVAAHEIKLPHMPKIPPPTQNSEGQIKLHKKS